MRATIVTLAAFLLSFALSNFADAREWRDAAGKVRAEGDFVALRKGKVYLEQADGTVVTLAFDSLSLVDLSKNEVVKTTKLKPYGDNGQTAAFSPDGSLLAVGEDYNLALWDVQTGKELPKLESNDTQWSCVFTPDGTRLISGAAGKINVWDVRKGQCIRSFDTAGSSYIKAVAASPDNKHVAAIPDSAGQDLQVFRIPRVEK